MGCAHRSATAWRTYAGLHLPPWIRTSGVLQTHPLEGTWRVAGEDPREGGGVLVTVTACPGGELSVTAHDAFDGEDFLVEVLRQAARSVTFRLTRPHDGDSVLKRLWLDSHGRPVVTLQYDERWERVPG